MPARDPQTARVPGFIHITADDWRAFAMYARAAAFQAEQDAKAQTNPTVREQFMREAQRAYERAEKAELAARVL